MDLAVVPPTPVAKADKDAWPFEADDDDNAADHVVQSRLAGHTNEAPQCEGADRCLGVDTHQQPMTMHVSQSMTVAASRLDLIVEPYLYLSGMDAAMDIARLDNAGITHIINMAVNEVHTGSKFYQIGRQYLGIGADDKIGYDLRQHFEQCFEFIDAARKAGGRVLVHCVMGASRSATIVAAYVMREQRMRAACAVALVKDLRACARPNEGFMLQLFNFERELKLPHPSRSTTPDRRAISSTASTLSAGRSISGSVTPPRRIPHGAPSGRYDQHFENKSVRHGSEYWMRHRPAGHQTDPGGSVHLPHTPSSAGESRSQPNSAVKALDSVTADQRTLPPSQSSPEMRPDKTASGPYPAPLKKSNTDSFADIKAKLRSFFS